MPVSWSENNGMTFFPSDRRQSVPPMPSTSYTSSSMAPDTGSAFVAASGASAPSRSMPPPSPYWGGRVSQGTTGGETRGAMHGAKPSLPLGENRAVSNGANAAGLLINGDRSNANEARSSNSRNENISENDENAIGLPVTNQWGGTSHPSFNNPRWNMAGSQSTTSGTTQITGSSQSFGGQSSSGIMANAAGPRMSENERIVKDDANATSLPIAGYSGSEWSTIVATASSSFNNSARGNASIIDKDKRAASQGGDTSVAAQRAFEIQQSSNAAPATSSRTHRLQSFSAAPVASSSTHGLPSFGSPYIYDKDDEATTQGGDRAGAAHEKDLADIEGRRLYVANIGFATTVKDLTAFFKGFLVESIVIPKNTYTKSPRGYAFVDLSSPAEAERSIAELSGKEILNRPVSVQLARTANIYENQQSSNAAPAAPAAPSVQISTVLQSAFPYGSSTLSSASAATSRAVDLNPANYEPPTHVFGEVLPKDNTLMKDVKVKKESSAFSGWRKNQPVVKQAIQTAARPRVPPIVAQTHLNGQKHARLRKSFRALSDEDLDELLELDPDMKSKFERKARELHDANKQSARQEVELELLKLMVDIPNGEIFSSKAFRQSTSSRKGKRTLSENRLAALIQKMLESERAAVRKELEEELARKAREPFQIAQKDPQASGSLSTLPLAYPIDPNVPEHTNKLCEDQLEAELAKRVEDLTKNLTGEFAEYKKTTDAKLKYMAEKLTKSPEELFPTNRGQLLVKKYMPMDIPKGFENQRPGADTQKDSLELAQGRILQKIEEITGRQIPSQRVSSFEGAAATAMTPSADISPRSHGSAAAIMKNSNGKRPLEDDFGGPRAVRPKLFSTKKNNFENASFTEEVEQIRYEAGVERRLHEAEAERIRLDEEQCAIEQQRLECGMTEAPAAAMNTHSPPIHPDRAALQRKEKALSSIVQYDEITPPLAAGKPLFYYARQYPEGSDAHNILVKAAIETALAKPAARKVLSKIWPLSATSLDVVKGNSLLELIAEKFTAEAGSMGLDYLERVFEESEQGRYGLEYETKQILLAMGFPKSTFKYSGSPD